MIHNLAANRIFREESGEVRDANHVGIQEYDMVYVPVSQVLPCGQLVAVPAISETGEPMGRQPRL